MKTGKSLVELATELQRRHENKKDFVAQTSALEMTVSEAAEAKAEFEKLIQMKVGDRTFEANAVAHDQFGSFCGIPSAYYDRMLQNEPELLAHNVNTWLHKSKDARMLRTLDGKIRAFLSDRYRPIENEDLAAALLPILLEGGKFDLMSAEITDKKFYLKVVDHSVTRKLAETGNYMGDGQHRIIRHVAPAITISNSEVGLGSCSVQAGVFDGFCSNLATYGARSMRKYHTGARHDIMGDELVAVLSQETKDLTNKALVAQVRDCVKNAFNVDSFNQLCDQIDGTVNDKINKEVDVVKLVNLTSKKIGLTEGESRGVLQQLIEGADLTRFGLYNAVTRHSADIPSYDRATELERAGAQVVELPKTEWEQLLNQACLKN
jgi:hypothetical protein